MIINIQPLCVLSMFSHRSDLLSFVEMSFVDLFDQCFQSQPL